MPVYWKPRYGTRSSRHRAWVRADARREARQQHRSLWSQLRSLLKR